jgi:hypothetical protein
MSQRQIGRRQFVRTGSILLATAAADGTAQAAKPNQTRDTANILNYHSKMRYRRLGKTRLMLSEVSLGGHWRNRSGGTGWGTFANDQLPAEVARNRTEVVSACIDAGMNYLDITTAGECMAYGAALKGRREKMYIGADDHLLVLTGLVDAAERVLDLPRVDVLHLVLALVVLKAESVSLFEDEDLARVAVRVRQPALLAPGLGDNLHVVGLGDRRSGQGSLLGGALSLRPGDGIRGAPAPPGRTSA